jgi:hypothetical protein
MGIVEVAFFAAWAAGVFTATITATFNRTSSSTRAGSRSLCPAAFRTSMVMSWPSV